MIISGFTTFAPKFVEAQFNISAGIAAQLIGEAAHTHTHTHVHNTQHRGTAHR